MSVELERRQFTVKEYHTMAESGILTENDRVELISGEIVKMSPIGLRHAACVNRITKLFFRHFLERAIIHVQNPIRLNNQNELQPDLSLLQERDDFYEGKYPQPEDVFLLIEVADSSIKYDRETKMPLYAKNGISEVWLIDINQQLVEVYRQPQGNSYQNVQQFFQGDILTIEAFNDINLAVDKILG
ncbi:Uma2 family endonuclease [Okeania sp.]|uniref:Uma2 family endonuclease n=1 Tax=Okeania sp. TaxID=3100323 RepID=UPI002B4AD0C5|nr:Uma2 family endonuclease [Okeania sp.]MEB3339980.1 Uma2 family endonuclease [Okeania sp.]